MKGDFTKNTFARNKHYAGVLMQQGRVELDADWNEQNDIVAQRQDSTTLDTVGGSGAPLHAAGFAVVAAATDLPAEDQARPENAAPPALNGPDLLVSGGRFYVDGQLAEKERIGPLSDQADLPKGLPRVRLSNGSEGAFPPPAGSYLAYLDVWQRHVTALEDESLREVALGGPDTATRRQALAQVKLLQVTAPASCDGNAVEWAGLIAASTGRLAARAEPDGTAASPCIVAPGAGYRRLENQLYRVEIHDGGSSLNRITLKWSRDNGSIVVKCVGKSGNDLLVASTGKDATLGFAAGQWVELDDDGHELAGKPGTLVRLKQVQGNALTVDPGTATGSLNLAEFPCNPKVRRWDMVDTAIQTADQLAGAGGWIPLEEGVQIKLTAGLLRSGDYWLIPARTATARVEWPAAGEPGFERLPAGIAHHYARLASVEFDGTGFKVTNDCRHVFPPLTEVDDGGAWHRRHNRHLHGWGVVCGLKVHCDSDRRFVNISKGHAIACDGSDLLLPAATRQDIVALATSRKLLDGQGNGKVELLLDRGTAAPRFDLRAYAGAGGQTFLQQVLSGTLLQDVLDDCLQPVLDFLRKQLFPATGDKTLVPEPARNRIAAPNLLVQLLNKSEGGNVFLSSDEHDRLAELFAALKDFIAVKSYCGMFDGLPKLPDYPFADLGLRTLYGKERYRRLRLAPDGGYAFAVDVTTRHVHGFNLKEGAAGVELEFPAIAGMTLTVQDVAFIGSDLLVAASGPDGGALCLFDGRKGRLLAGPVTFPEQPIVRLGNSPTDKENAYALVKGQGLFRVEAATLDRRDLGNAVLAFNATGHLEMGIGVAGRYAVATAAAGTAESDVYTQVQIIDLGGLYSRSLPLRDPAGNAVGGSDGLAVLLPPGSRTRKKDNLASLPGKAAIYVVIQPAANTTNKRLLVLEPLEGAPVATLTLPTAGPVSLLAAPDQDMMLAAMAEHFQIARIDRDSNQFSDALLFPTQLVPAALAATPKGDAVLAANAGSLTLSYIPTGLLAARPGVDRAKLADYRQGMVDAFLALLARLVQMIKDCICDHLLVECPQCGKDDRVVLAAIEVKGNKVQAICAFERREVVTFPKLFYWLSAVPVVPLLTRLVEEFCCARLPELAAAYFKKSGNFTSAATLDQLASVELTNLQATGRDTIARSALLLRHMAQASLRDVLPFAAADSQRVLVADVVNKAPAAAARPLEEAGATVTVASYDESLAKNALREISSVPLDIKPGDRINLYTRDGQVVFYTRDEAPLAAVAAPRAAAGALQDEVAALRGELAARDQRIAGLEKNVADLQGVATQLKTLQKQVAALKPKGGGTR